ncbi:hypothetical protein ACTHSL_00310 [Neisseria sp. P0008.S010]|uniref:hypothetical protein n=1 Tax=Neisseria sp. P0008.S010 TaxID=3436707 RepID=UPI003F7FB8A9
MKICKGGIIGRLPAAGNSLLLQMSRLFYFSDGLYVATAIHMFGGRLKTAYDRLRQVSANLKKAV